MSIAKEYTKLVAERKGWQGDIDYEHNPVVRAMIGLLTKDVEQTVHFLKEECSSEQMIWLSEILDEIIEITKSKKIVDACYIVAERYPEAAKEYNIKFFIDSAAEYLE